MSNAGAKGTRPSERPSKRAGSGSGRSETSVSVSDPTKGPRDRNYFLKYPQSVWHEQAVELPELDSSEPLKDDARILRLKEEAKQLYEKLSAEFEESALSTFV